MSTRNLIDAIASGSALDIESAFEDTMAEKVSVQIEAKRLQIAQTMFTTEEVDLDEEQLDELSPKTLGSYVKKASRSVGTISTAVGTMDGSSRAETRNSHWGPLLKNKVASREKNISKAVNKLVHKANEEVDLDEEQLDELSVKTLSSYARKSASDAVSTAQHLGANKQRNMRQHGDIQDVPDQEDKQTWSQPSDETVARKKLEKHLNKRGAGFNRAMKKIVKKTNEEVDLDEEQLDELSKKTLGSYIKKATDSNFADPRTIGNLSSKSTEKDIRSGGEDGGEEEHKAKMRSKGVAKAVNRLTKEEVDLDEEQSEQE